MSYVSAAARYYVLRRRITFTTCMIYMICIKDSIAHFGMLVFLTYQCVDVLFALRGLDEAEDHIGPRHVVSIYRLRNDTITCT